MSILKFFLEHWCKTNVPLGGSGPTQTCEIIDIISIRCIISIRSIIIGPISIIDTVDISDIIRLMRISIITLSAWVSFLKLCLQKFSLIR